MEESRGGPAVWFRGYKNLIFYSRFYGDKKEIKLSQLEDEHLKEQVWFEYLKGQIDCLDRITLCVSESKHEMSKKLPMFGFIKDRIEYVSKQQADSLFWLDILDKCMIELKDKESKTV